MSPDRQPLASVLNAGTQSKASPGVEEVLDAALAQFEDLGIRRSTIEDIARRAGIDRVTVYRRVGSKDDLTQKVIAREVQRLLEEVMAASASLPTFEERIAVAFTTAIQHVRKNTLYKRVLALEAETVLPHLTTEAGPLLSTGVAATASLIHQAQQDGILGEVSNPQAVAEVLVRVVHSFVLTPRGILALQSDAKLTAFARSHLAPIITRHSQPPRRSGG
ncbi:MAG: TetR/AcrR family transcriptional regulator [Solirubrobacteraceae bacterium]